MPWQASAVMQILESEGAMQSKINQAEGDKAEIILTSEAAKMDAINRATGAGLPCSQHGMRLSDLQQCQLM